MSHRHTISRDYCTRNEKIPYRDAVYSWKLLINPTYLVSRHLPQQRFLNMTRSHDLSIALSYTPSKIDDLAG